MLFILKILIMENLMNLILLGTLFMLVYFSILIRIAENGYLWRLNVN